MSFEQPLPLESLPAEGSSAPLPGGQAYLPGPAPLSPPSTTSSGTFGVTSVGRALSPSIRLQGVGEFPPAFRHRVTQVRSRYRELYDLPVVEHPDGRRTFQQGALHRRHGLYVLFLKGDGVEMAFQHGRLLAEEIAAGPVGPSATQIERTVANTYGKYGPLQRLIAEGIHRFITSTMLSCALDSGRRYLGEEETFDETIGLSDATGIPVTTLVRALFGPEVLLLLATLDSDARREHVPVRTELPVPITCSTFAAWGSYTTTGDLLIGRNMDYPLHGYYDQFPTVIYFEPTDGKLKHMAFVSAGIHNAGMNGYNEAGIFVATHSVPSTEVSARGVPVFATAQHVIREARTFDEALTMFRQAPSAAGWGYMLASTKENRVATLELSNKQVVVRESEGEFHVQTNHYLTPELRDKNLLINTSVAEDNDGRYIRLKQRLEEARSKVDAQQAISILGDQVDPYVGETRGLGSTVGVHTTMTSLVLEPSKGTFYMAAGRAPVCHGPYVELPLVGGENDPRSLFDQQAPCRVLENREFREQHPEKSAALQLFIEAKNAYEYKNDFRQAYNLLQDVVQVDDSNPAYYFQLGIFALKCRDYDGAVNALSAVLNRPYITSQLRRLAQYYRGRTLAHLGCRDAAVSDFAQVLDDAETDNKLRAAARRASRTTSLFGNCTLPQRSLTIMMQQSDMLHY